MGDALMYLLYEHHYAPDGAVLATDMIMTSVYPGRKGINWKSAADSAIFEFSKIVFKDVHIANRSYDNKSNVWTFLGTAGKDVYEKLKASPIIAVGLKLEAVEDLADQASSGYIKRPIATKWNANDFFYNPQGVQTGSTALTREVIAAKLSTLLLLPEAEILSGSAATLKKPYRAAALRLHPDRNQGDGSGMTELNYLWQQLTPFIGGA